jgi:hypothetical protein
MDYYYHHHHHHTRLLVPSEGYFHRADVVVVDEAGSSLQVLSHPVGPGYIPTGKREQEERLSVRDKLVIRSLHLNSRYSLNLISSPPQPIWRTKSNTPPIRTYPIHFEEPRREDARN